ncbi:hypothetical protein IAT40_001160 [Kwoniella sp. CBS 6097]
MSSGWGSAAAETAANVARSSASCLNTIRSQIHRQPDDGTAASQEVASGYQAADSSGTTDGSDNVEAGTTDSPSFAEEDAGYFGQMTDRREYDQDAQPMQTPSGTGWNTPQQDTTSDYEHQQHQQQQQQQPYNNYGQQDSYSGANGQ